MWLFTRYILIILIKILSNKTGINVGISLPTVFLAKATSTYYFLMKLVIVLSKIASTHSIWKKNWYSAIGILRSRKCMAGNKCNILLGKNYLCGNFSWVPLRLYNYVTLPLPVTNMHHIYDSWFIINSIIFYAMPYHVLPIVLSH